MAWPVWLPVSCTDPSTDTHCQAPPACWPLCVSAGSFGFHYSSTSWSKTGLGAGSPARSGQGVLRGQQLPPHVPQKLEVPVPSAGSWPGSKCMEISGGQASVWLAGTTLRVKAYLDFSAVPSWPNWAPTPPPGGPGRGLKGTEQATSSNQMLWVSPQAGRQEGARKAPVPPGDSGVRRAQPSGPCSDL